MKLALIPPIDMLEYTEETNLQLMLPQMLQDDVYRYVYTRHCKDASQFVILDNGANEDAAITTGELIRLGNEYGVNEIVIPDVIKNSAETIAEYERFYSYARQSMSLRNLRTMYVLQGSNFDEFIDQIAFVTESHFKADTIGIPRHAIETCNLRRVRVEFAAQLRNFGWKGDIHLLGGSPSHPTEMTEFRNTKRLRIRSTDTSAPFNFAYYGELLRVDAVTCRRPTGYFGIPFEEFNVEVLEKNIGKLQKWTKDAG